MKKIKKLSIFVAEDNLIYQQLIAKQLEPISYGIKFFTSGEECVEELKKVTPDVMVLDNNLEGLLSGLDTLKLIRVLHPELYVIIFSTEKDLDTVDNINSYGTFVYVEKSISSFRLLKEKIAASEIYLQKEVI